MYLILVWVGFDWCIIADWKCWTWSHICSQISRRNCWDLLKWQHFPLLYWVCFWLGPRSFGTQWTDMYLVDDCMECLAGNVILKWLCYSPLCSDDGNGLQCGDDDWSSWMRVVFQILPAKLNSKFLHHVMVWPPCVPRSPWMLTPCDQNSGWPYDGPYCPFYRKPLMQNDLSLKPSHNCNSQHFDLSKTWFFRENKAWHFELIFWQMIHMKCHALLSLLSSTAFQGLNI